MQSHENFTKSFLYTNHMYLLLVLICTMLIFVHCFYAFLCALCCCCLCVGPSAVTTTASLPSGTVTYLTITTFSLLLQLHLSTCIMFSFFQLLKSFFFSPLHLCLPLSHLLVSLCLHLLCSHVSSWTTLVKVPSGTFV
jgi:hypothetical protein